MAIFASFVAYRVYFSHRRTKALIALANSRGMQRLTGLPRNLRLAGTGLEGGTPRNIWETSGRAGRTLFFDIRVGQGKGAWHRTVFGTQTPPSLFAAAAYGRDFVTEHAGEWLIMYESRAGVFRFTPGTLPVSEMASASGRNDEQREHRNGPGLTPAYTLLMIEVPMSDEQFASATERLRANGIELAGPTGTLTKDGITAKYDYAGGKLRIEIVEKPFLLPTSLIEGRLQAYLDQSLAAGNTRP